MSSDQGPRHRPSEVTAQSRRVAALLALGVIAVNAVIIAIGVRGLLHSREQTVAQVRETTATLATLGMWLVHRASSGSLLVRGPALLHSRSTVMWPPR